MSQKIYEMITKRIIEKLEQGTVPWKKPWNADNEMPVNFISKRPYRGINTFLLGCQGYGSNFWLTFNQTSKAGGKVRKGEKATPVVFWKMIDVEEKNSETGEAKLTQKPILRYYYVFNYAQCEDLKPIPEPEPRDVQKIQACEKIIISMPDKPGIEHGGIRACYIPNSDSIRIPAQRCFASDEEFYSTLFHEMVHSTGHISRLKRKDVMNVKHFGSHEYSKEELIAEMGATFLCGHARIGNETIDNSASYISSWLKVFKNDSKMVIFAAAGAQKAADFILNFK